MTPRRALALAILAALVLTSIDYRLLSIFGADQERIRYYLTRTADSGWYPEYPRFLDGVRAHTKNGDTIALIVPARKWNEGYAYGYYRASYFLAGREVLPVVKPDDALIRENFDRAPYAMFWHSRYPRNARIVWQGDGGVLVAKR